MNKTIVPASEDCPLLIAISLGISISSEGRLSRSNRLWECPPFIKKSQFLLAFQAKSLFSTFLGEFLLVTAYRLLDGLVGVLHAFETLDFGVFA